MCVSGLLGSELRRLFILAVTTILAILAGPSVAAPAGPPPDQADVPSHACVQGRGSAAADCHAIRVDRIDKATGKAVTRSAISGTTAAQLRTAYGISSGAGGVVAIVDAYDAPSAYSDLSVYRLFADSVGIMG